jgi:hypothetical protein
MLDAGCLTSLEHIAPLCHVCIYLACPVTVRELDACSPVATRKTTVDTPAAVRIGERATDGFFRSMTWVEANDNTAESLTKWIAITTLFTLLSTWLFLRRNNSLAPVEAEGS